DAEAAQIGLNLKQYGGDGRPIDLNDPQAIEKARRILNQATGDQISEQDRKDLQDQLDKLEKDAKEAKSPDFDAKMRDQGIAEIHNEQDLKNTLAEAKTEGKLPIIVRVDTSSEPFFTDSGGGAAGGSGGGHAVTITDYDPA